MANRYTRILNGGGYVGCKRNLPAIRLRDPPSGHVDESQPRLSEQMRGSGVVGGWLAE